MDKKRDPIAVEQGRRLRVERDAREWSQSELAKRARLKPAAIGNYEQGTRQIRLAQARKLGEVFSLPAAYFMLELSKEEADVIRVLRQNKPADIQ